MIVNINLCLGEMQFHPMFNVALFSKRTDEIYNMSVHIRKKLSCSF